MQTRIVRHDEVDSTSERAFAELAAGRARHGDVHVARTQTRGRGRRGARWESPAGEGLYASLVLLPDRSAAPAGPVLAATLALRETILSLGDVPPGELVIKWPNDLLHRAPGSAGAKLAGILVETRGLDPERPHFVVGIGVNVLQREFPSELTDERPVTSLARMGLATTPEELLEALLPRLTARLAQWTDDPAGLERDYLDATGLRERSVEVEAGSRVIAGRLRGLTLETGLSLESDGGPEVVPLGHARSIRPIHTAGRPADSEQT